MTSPAPLRLVIDTNVVVAALLHPGRTPDLVLESLRARAATILVDSRIEAEYRAVLSRAKFAALPLARRSTMLAALLDRAERVACAPFAHAMIDDDDRAFVEVARSGRADALITGNAKHFPIELGVTVLSPAALLARLERL
ncbi:MAG: putative toxin-antitoxin system toxin component, PIN family [Myxococcota bacterium]|nr:putative toxin-antitoxin system toxin component, PIN family [Myxococcota bacterium]